MAVYRHLIKIVDNEVAYNLMVVPICLDISIPGKDPTGVYNFRGKQEAQNWKSQGRGAAKTP